MNERIKELAREAGLLTYNPEGPPTKLEKFAELIVEECARVADESLNIITMKPEWPSKYIKEHFGVEE